MSKIKIKNELYEKIKDYAEQNGYSSVEEFAEHLFEQIVKNPANGEMDKDVMERLKGLGYIS